MKRGPSSFSRRLRLSLWIAGGLAVLLALVLLGLCLAAKHEPAFYRTAMQIEPAALEKGSDRTLQQAAALQSAVRKEGRWEALFTAEQINGWLAVDRLKNHPNSLPPGWRDPRVAIDSKQIALGCRYDGAWLSSVLSVTVEPCVAEPSVLALRIVRARAGLLPLPLGPILRRLSEAARQMRIHLEQRQADGHPVAMFSLPESEDDRAVQIDALHLGDGEIYVAGSTKRKDP